MSVYDKEIYQEGGSRHWQNRTEKNWKKFEFNQPYAKGLKRLKEKILGHTNFDAATLWQWGTMQAMALIDILKSAEKKFGAEGQELVLESLRRVGHDIGRQIVDGTRIDDEISTEEFISFFASVVNRIA